MQTDLEWSLVAKEAAEAGGKILKKYFRNVDPSLIEAKRKNDWVSVADRASETAVIEVIRLHAPDHAIFSEEAGYLAPAKGLSAYCWIIDPLDGTTNFLRGFPIWAVSVGLEYRADPNAKWGEIVAGAVAVPPTGELFRASKNGGAFRNDERFTTGKGRPFGESLLGTGYPFKVRHLRDEHLKLFHDLLARCADVRRPGAAAVDLCYTAMGVYDAFWEPDLFPWDIAAGELIIREAGGVVSDFRGGTDILTAGDIVAGHRRIFDELLNAVRLRFDHLTPRSVDKSPKR